MNADIDFGELFVTVKDYFTGQPFVSSDGRTTKDMKYENCSVDLQMYEPKNHQLSSASVELVSLLKDPGLRELYQKIKEGARVEIYDFQPDCGDPIFAGFIPPNGLIEENGSLIMSVHDPLEQGKWQHLQLIEENSLPISQWYTRALSHWIDLVNEDFSAGPMPSGYGLTANAPAATGVWSPGKLHVNYGTNNNSIGAYGFYYTPATFTPAPGDTYLIDAYVTFFQQGLIVPDGLGANYYQGAELWLELSGASQTGITFVWEYSTPVSNPAAAFATSYQEQQFIVTDNSGATILNTIKSSSGPPINYAGAWLVEQTPVTHRITCLVIMDPNIAGLMTLVMAIDGQPYTSSTCTVNNLGPVMPTVSIRCAGATPYVELTKLRYRKLVPYIYKAAHFVPQTSSPIYFQPNQEDLVSFLDFLAENDNTEFRVKYKAAPVLDELELDAVGFLGKNASQQIFYDARSPIVIPPKSPASAGTNVGNF